VKDFQDDQLIHAFQKDLLRWFGEVKRDLPWRRDRDPYRVWLSEVMLQQTRVDQAAPYFHRFTEAFPTVADLASAELDDVLLLWEGLGYYSRARNLHRAAQVVMEEYAGYLPETRQELKSLPGIGEYTSAAIASLAFDEVTAAVDGNVIRVMARVFALIGDRKSARLRTEIQKLSDSLIPGDSPGAYNEALMELGARVCTPRSPNCQACPLNRVCTAFRLGAPESYPQPAETRIVPHHDIAIGLVFDDGRLLIQKRSEEAMLGGLWEFPGGKVEGDETLSEACIREVAEETGLAIAIDEALNPVRHAYSHFRITLHPFICSVTGGVMSPSTTTREWIRLDDADLFAFPRANRKVFEQLDSRAGMNHRAR
jgi:A/G-specific adenine glycosylase